MSALLPFTLGIVGLAALAGMGLGDLRALYRECAGRVMAVALHLLRDRAEAEDVVQETFLELWRRAGAFDPSRASPAAYAVLIARSRALDRLRARSALSRAEGRATLDPPDPPAGPASQVEAGQEGARVRQALGALPPEQRRVVELAFFEGLSQREIADRTQEPLGTVKTRVRLGMEKLALALAEDGAGGAAP